MYRKTKAILKEFKRIVNPQNRTYGSVLKHFRKKKELTLEEVAKDICSISYLCKVERDQLVPNKDKLKLLMTRLGIKETDINPNEKDTKYINELARNNYVSDELYNEFRPRHDYQSKIVTFAKHVLNEKDLDLSKKLKYETIDYFFNFSKIEMEYVLYLIICDAYIRENYQRAIMLFKELDKINEDKNIMINAVVVCVKALYQLDRLNDVEIIIKTYIEIFFKYSRYEELNILKNIELKIMARVGIKEDLEYEISLIRNDEDINIDFIWFNYHYYNDKNYQKALKYINKIKSLNHVYYLHYLVCLENLKLTNRLIENLNNPIFELEALSHQMLFNLLKCKYIDGDDLNENNEFLYINHLTDNHYVLSYIYKILLKESKDTFQYKRSCIILEKKNEILREKASIIYCK